METKTLILIVLLVVTVIFLVIYMIKLFLDKCKEGLSKLGHFIFRFILLILTVAASIVCILELSGITNWLNF